MREVEVKKSSDGVTVYVGTVNQSSNYNSLSLSEAEAALLMERLRNTLTR